VKRLLLATAIVAASFAVPAANATCAGSAIQVCTTTGCSGHPCVIDPLKTRVEITCNHPTPTRVCAPLGPSSS
jgi:expansin (peptidoglycan-binding protein)